MTVATMHAGGPESDLRRRAACSWPLVPAGLTLYLALRGGGFFPGTTGLVAAELALLLAGCAALARRPLAGASRGLAVALAALGALAAWSLLSSRWSHSPARALLEYDRILLYALAVLLGAWLPFSGRRIRVGVRAMAVAIVAIAVCALIARAFPHVVRDPALLTYHRLAFPLGYWNALGLLCAIGLVFCLHLTSSEREPASWRVLAAGGIPLLAATVHLTSSRAAAWGSLAALALYVALARPRLLAAGLLSVPAVVPAVLLSRIPSRAGEVQTEPWLAAGLAGCALAAAALRWLLLRLDSGRGRGAARPRRRRRTSAAAAAAAAIALAGGVALGVPERIAAGLRDFGTYDPAVTSPGSGRLLSLTGNGRPERWRVALQAWRSSPLTGTGAGTYPLEWAARRAAPYPGMNAHSLYLELLGELGLPGLALLVIGLLAILGGLAARLRSSDRDVFAAILAAGVLWAGAAGIDWLWESPAVGLWLFWLGGAGLARAPGEPSTRGRRQSRAVLRTAAIVASIALAVAPVRIALSDARLQASIAALRGGDCRRASLEAQAALAFLDRPAAHEALGICAVRAARYRSGVRELRAAAAGDPGNWRVLQALAVAAAAAGLEWREYQRRAIDLNPREPVLRSTLVRLRASAGSEARSFAREAPLGGPQAGDP